MKDGLGYDLMAGQKVVWSPASTSAGFVFGVVHHLNKKLVSVQMADSSFVPQFSSPWVNDPSAQHGVRQDTSRSNPILSNVQPQNLIIVDRIIDHGVV